MSNWTHPICAACFAEERPDVQPSTLVEQYRVPEVCCRCGVETRDGIYWRVDPKSMAFHSEHDE